MRKKSCIQVINLIRILTEKEVRNMSVCENYRAVEEKVSKCM